MGYTGSMVATPLERLSQARREAEIHLTAVAGGAPLCRLDTRGDVGGVKYAEGRMAAIAEAQRHARAAGADRSDEIGPILAATLRAWDDQLRSAATPTWSAYRAGGVDALRGLLAELHAPIHDDERPPPTSA